VESRGAQRPFRRPPEGRAFNMARLIARGGTAAADLDAARSLEFLSRIVDLLSTSAERRALLDAALDASLVPLGLSKGAVFLRKGATDALEVGAARGFPVARGGAAAAPGVLEAGMGLANVAIRRKGAFAIPDLSREAHAKELHGACLSAGLTVSSAALVPVAVGPRALGAILVVSEPPRDFTASERGFLKLVGALLGWTLVGQGALRDVEARNEELKTLARALDQRTAELKELDQYKTRSIHLITHEMRKPLTPIFTYADMLLGLDFPPEKQRHFLEQIRSAADEMNQYVSEMIETAKLEEGGIQMLFEDADVVAAAEGAVGRWRKEAQTAGVTLEAHSDLVRRVYTTDGVKIGEILENLIENGIKYTPESGKVSVNLRKNGPDLEMSVKDTGIGIAPEDLPGLFQKFNIIKKAAVPRPTHRAGLGLYLARVYAEALGGSIGVTSELGKGSTFTVRIPVGT